MTLSFIMQWDKLSFPLSWKNDNDSVMEIAWMLRFDNTLHWLSPFITLRSLVKFFKFRVPLSFSLDNTVLASRIISVIWPEQTNSLSTTSERILDTSLYQNAHFKF